MDPVLMISMSLFVTLTLVGCIIWFEYLKDPDLLSETKFYKFLGFFSNLIDKGSTLIRGSCMQSFKTYMARSAFAVSFVCISVLLMCCFMGVVLSGAILYFFLYYLPTETYQELHNNWKNCREKCINDKNEEKI
jgi:hypothetical protein